MAIPRSYTALLTRGYLPKEIPPAFSSEKLARFTLPNRVRDGQMPGGVPAEEGMPLRFSSNRAGEETAGGTEPACLRPARAVARRQLGNARTPDGYQPSVHVAAGAE